MIGNKKQQLIAPTEQYLIRTKNTKLTTERYNGTVQGFQFQIHTYLPLREDFKVLKNPNSMQSDWNVSFFQLLES
jgi:hypothetical protein